MGEYVQSEAEKGPCGPMVYSYFYKASRSVSIATLNIRFQETQTSFIVENVRRTTRLNLNLVFFTVGCAIRSWPIPLALVLNVTVATANQSTRCLCTLQE